MTSTHVTATDRVTPTGMEKIVRKKPNRIATVPSKEDFLHGHIQRKMPGKITEFQLFDYSLMERLNVLVEGPTGTGKTSAIMAWAASRKFPFYSISSSIGLEPSQLFGKFVPDGDGGIVWQDGPVTDIVRHGGVLLINEINFIPERVGTVLFSLLDKRRQIQLPDHHGETIDAHDKTVIFADMNPDYAGTRPLNAALRNRFSVQLVWDYDTEIELQLVQCSKLVELAGKFRSRVKSGEMETPVATNMLVEFEKNCSRVNFEFAKENFINHFSVDEREPARKTIDTMQSELLVQIQTLERRTPYGDSIINEDGEEWNVDWQYSETDFEVS